MGFWKSWYFWVWFVNLLLLSCEGMPVEQTPADNGNQAVNQSQAVATNNGSSTNNGKNEKKQSADTVDASTPSFLAVVSKTVPPVSIDAGSDTFSNVVVSTPKEAVDTSPAYVLPIINPPTTVDARPALAIDTRLVVPVVPVTCGVIGLPCCTAYTCHEGICNPDLETPLCIQYGMPVVPVAPVDALVPPTIDPLPVDPPVVIDNPDTLPPAPPVQNDNPDLAPPSVVSPDLAPAPKLDTAPLACGGVNQPSCNFGTCNPGLILTLDNHCVTHCGDQNERCCSLATTACSAAYLSCDYWGYSPNLPPSTCVCGKSGIPACEVLFADYYFPQIQRTQYICDPGLSSNHPNHVCL
jgi:hypothetical protein